MASSYSDRQYISFDPFEGDRDVDVRERKVAVVKVRKPHTCISPTGSTHPIEPGERARNETAIVEGKWASYYTCVPCMDAWLQEIGERPEPQP